jgi:hypothetical protein
MEKLRPKDNPVQVHSESEAEQSLLAMGVIMGSGAGRDQGVKDSPQPEVQGSLSPPETLSGWIYSGFCPISKV